MKITVAWAHEHHACWGDPELTHVLEGGRELKDLLADEEINPKDRSWLAAHALPSALRDQWMYDSKNGFVTRAVRSYCLSCGVSDVEHWARTWLSDADRSEAAAAETSSAAAKVAKAARTVAVTAAAAAAAREATARETAATATAVAAWVNTRGRYPAHWSY